MFERRQTVYMLYSKEEYYNLNNEQTFDISYLLTIAKNFLFSATTKCKWKQRKILDHLNNYCRYTTPSQPKKKKKKRDSKLTTRKEFSCTIQVIFPCDLHIELSIFSQHASDTDETPCFQQCFPSFPSIKVPANHLLITRSLLNQHPIICCVWTTIYVLVFQVQEL